MDVRTAPPPGARRRARRDGPAGSERNAARLDAASRYQPRAIEGDLRGRHIVSVEQFARPDLDALCRTAAELRRRTRSGDTSVLRLARRKMHGLGLLRGEHPDRHVLPGRDAADGRRGHRDERRRPVLVGLQGREPRGHRPRHRLLRRRARAAPSRGRLVVRGGLSPRPAGGASRHPLRRHQRR